MENKSLSEQICEACGLEPYYGLKIYNYDDNGRLLNCELVTDKRKYRLIADLRGFADVDDDYFKNIERKYLPDFENNNNNFVKLMELDFDSCSDEDTKFPSLWCFLNSLMFALESREDYLFYLLSFLKDNRSEWRENLQRDVKQAIRQADWEV